MIGEEWLCEAREQVWASNPFCVGHSELEMEFPVSNLFLKR